MSLKPFLLSGEYFVLTSAILVAALFVFDKVTKYSLWREIEKGNLAVAFSSGGITLGIANILRAAVSSNVSLPGTLVWGCAGTAVLLIVYFGFELLTPKLKVSDEIGKGNTAVGFISFSFSIAMSLVIGAVIS